LRANIRLSPEEKATFAASVVSGCTRNTRSNPGRKERIVALKNIYMKPAVIKVVPKAGYLLEPLSGTEK
jgi:hypothetical protein